MEQAGATEPTTTGWVKPVLAAMFVAIVASFIPAGVAQWADSAEPFGAWSWEWANGAARLVIALIAAVLIIALGWSRTSGLTSRIDWAGFRTPVAIFAIASSLIPVIGLFTTSWEATEAIAAKVWYFGMTGPYEELVFRGLLFHGLARYWGGTVSAVRRAALLSAGLFGLLHIAPIAIVITFIAGIAFTGLVVATRSLWPAMIAHSVYDILADFPLDADGVFLDDDAIGGFLALPLLLISAFFAWRFLARPGGADLSQPAGAVPDSA